MKTNEWVDTAAKRLSCQLLHSKRFKHFTRRFYLFEESRIAGNRMIVEAGPANVCSPCTDEYVAGKLSRYYDTALQHFVDIPTAVRAVNLWRYRAEDQQDRLLPEPPVTVGRYGDAEPCYWRMPFEILPLGYNDLHQAPTWKEFVDRCENALPMLAWWGALFDPDSKNQQYLWLYGKGRDGKSTLQRFFERFMFGVSQAVSMKNASRFQAYSWLYMRLLMFSDTNQQKATLTELVKSITGGDAIEIEKKYGDSWSRALACRLAFFSNHKPDMLETPAERRRLIFVPVKPFKARLADPTVEARLWDERQVFISICCNEYEKSKALSSEIDTDDRVTDELFQSNESDFRALAESLIMVTGQDTDRFSQQKLKTLVMEQDRTIRTNHDYARFKDWLSSGHFSQKLQLKKAPRNSGRFCYEWAGGRLCTN